MTEAEILAAAARLDEAETMRRQIRMISLDHPGMTMDDAYRVQKAWMDRKLAAGRRVIGHKIGLTSKAMQSTLGVDTPDSGILLDDMLFPDSGMIPAERFIALRAEVELAFILRTPLKGPGRTMLDVYDATAYVIPAIELLDTRILRVDPQKQRNCVRAPLRCRFTPSVLSLPRLELVRLNQRKEPSRCNPSSLAQAVSCLA